MKRLYSSLLILIVLLGLLIPAAAAQSPRTPITAENAADVTELAVLGRGTGLSLEWSPDGSQFAIATTIGVWLYDGADLAAEPVLIPTTASVDAIAFSADSSQLAVIVGKLLTVWDPTTQREIGAFEVEITGAVKDMIFGADGSWVALASSKKLVYLVELATGTVTATLEGHTSDVMALALSSDGGILASGSKDNTVKLWNTADFTELMTLEGHEGYIGGMAFSPDDASIYVGDSKTTVIQWDTVSGEQLAMWKPEKGSYVVDLALTSDGATLLVGEGNNGGVRVWDTASGTETALYDVHAYRDINSFFRTNAIALSPDDTTLATVGSEGPLRFWDAATGENLITNTYHAEIAWSVAFSPDGAELSTSYDLGAWRIWDVASTDLVSYTMGVFRLGFSDNKTSNVYSPDSSQLAARDSFEIAVYDTATRTMLYSYRLSNNNSVIYSADGTLLIAAGDFLAILDAATGDELVKLDNHTGIIYSVALSADQSLIATASKDGTVRLWGIP